MRKLAMFVRVRPHIIYLRHDHGAQIHGASKLSFNQPSVPVGTRLVGMMERL